MDWRIAGAFGFTFLIMAVQRPDDRGARTWCAVVMALEVFVGLLGAAFQVTANMHGAAESWYDRLVFGAPVFAPLLFCNLALLAV
jgi:hypothetical protein